MGTFFNLPRFSFVFATIEKPGKLKNVPMLILWGAHDFVFDLDYYAEWKKFFPTAQHHVFKDAGHYVLEDAGNRIIELMDSFLLRS